MLIEPSPFQFITFLPLNSSSCRLISVLTHTNKLHFGIRAFLAHFFNNKVFMKEKQKCDTSWLIFVITHISKNKNYFELQSIVTCNLFTQVRFCWCLLLGQRLLTHFLFLKFLSWKIRKSTRKVYTFVCGRSAFEWYKSSNCYFYLHEHIYSSSFLIF